MATRQRRRQTRQISRQEARRVIYLALKGSSRIIESCQDIALQQDSIGLNETELLVSLLALVSQVEDHFDDRLAPAAEITQRRLVRLNTALGEARDSMATFYQEELWRIGR